jgi:hypothetical protein
MKCNIGRRKKASSRFLCLVVTVGCTIYVSLTDAVQYNRLRRASLVACKCG